MFSGIKSVIKSLEDEWLNKLKSDNPFGLNMKLYYA